jgi:hypothetical protein
VRFVFGFRMLDGRHARTTLGGDDVYDRLREANRSWRIYFGDFPLALLFEHERRPDAAKHYFDIDRFGDDVDEGAAAFPDFTFIEPRYLWPGTDDDHPPHAIADGERLIAKVYNTIRGSDLWKSTLLVVTYDEHGGFYDHVTPGPARPPDAHREEYTFDQYGVRVPALLISPWVGTGVFHDVLDHTSLLRYLTDLWSLGPLGDRTAHANSIAPAIRSDGSPREDTPATVPAGVAPRAVPSLEHLTDLQRAIVGFSQVLEKATKDTPQKRVARSMALMEGAPTQAAVAEERARRFLRERGAKIGRTGRTARPAPRRR